MPPIAPQATEARSSWQGCVSDTDDNAGEFHCEDNWIVGIRLCGVLADHALEPVERRCAEHAVCEWFVRECGGDQSARDRVLVESKFS